ncbi:PhzF family phenazine biosynthesis protein [bacterium]|nr:PhzF family phenazine biosynthesis protein [bacterium]
MKKLWFYQVDAFTHKKFRANHAGVVPEADGLSEDQMQQIIRERNNSEIAFLLSQDASDHDVRVGFFIPQTAFRDKQGEAMVIDYLRHFKFHPDEIDTLIYQEQIDSELY